MTQTRIYISGTAYCIDMDHLCSRNDFDKITNHFDMDMIDEVTDGIEDTFDRMYVIEAIKLSWHKQNCKQNINDFLNIKTKQAELERDYQVKKAEKEKESNEKACKEMVEAIESDTGNGSRYSVRMIGYIFFFILEKLGLFISNDSTKNCNQNKIKEFLSKLTGYKFESFNQKLIPDFNNQATTKVWHNIANELESFLPNLSKEIRDRAEYG